MSNRPPAPPRHGEPRPRSWDRALGKPLLRALDRFFASESRVGDPVVFDPGRFAWTADLESRWRAVRDEAEWLCAVAARLPRFDEVSPDQARIAADAGWRTFFLRGFGFRSERAAALCPETSRMLGGIPGLETALFSILAPGTRIPLHSGISKALLRCHLGLLVPDAGPHCGMRVGDVLCTWQEGRCLVFDDTAPHSVWNDTDATRVVLLIDVRRPLGWRGRLVADAALAVLRRSTYVRDGRAGHAAWERRFDQWLREEEAGGRLPPAVSARAARSATASRARSDSGISA